MHTCSICSLPSQPHTLLVISNSSCGLCVHVCVTLLHTYMPISTLVKIQCLPSSLSPPLSLPLPPHSPPLPTSLSSPLPSPIPSPPCILHDQRLGCDGVLGSDKVLDQCGRCLHPDEARIRSDTCRQFIGQNLEKDLKKGLFCIPFLAYDHGISIIHSYETAIAHRQPLLP